MSERHDSAGHITQRIDKAEHDLPAPEYIMRSGESRLTDIVCFHCQQCAEKYLKALLVSLSVHFPKTHDLRLLLDMIPEHVSLDLQPTRVIPLNRYVIEGRYPGEWEPITTEEAGEALAMARGVRAAVRATFPDDAERDDRL